MDFIHRRAFGPVLRRLREQAGLTQEQLAAAIDVNRGYISDLERGECDPRLGAVFLLAAVLGIPASWLIIEVEQDRQLFDQCKGTHIVEIDVDERVLVVTLGGTAECSACLQTWRQVLNIAQEKGVHGILMNALAVDGCVDMRDHNLIDAEVAAYMVERQMNVKRAMVGRPPTVIRAAGHQSGRTGVFSTVEEALRWLKSA